MTARRPKGKNHKRTTSWHRGGDEHHRWQRTRLPDVASGADPTIDAPNPGDVVLSPFAGIGSDLYVARRWGRRGDGIELLESYYRTAVTNLQRLNQHLAQDLRLVDVDPISPGRRPGPQHQAATERRPERNTARRRKASSQ